MQRSTVNTNHRLFFTDCTVRDGGYVNGFNISADETKEIVLVAERANIDYVEVGHGLGLNGSRQIKKAIISDLDYCRAAKSASKRIGWGTFCVGDWVTREDIRRVIDLQPAFIKVACDPYNMVSALKILEYIAHTPVKPILFLMKSYAWSKGQLIQAIKQASGRGVTTTSFVDSAGTMLPNEVAFLCKLGFDTSSDHTFGIHAHNNLGLAVANTLSAIDAGATYVDASMMGVGRSSGNCCLEQILFCLERKNIAHTANVYELLSFSKDFLSKILRLPPLDALDIVGGYAGFHSAYTEILSQSSFAKETSLMHFIVELCKITKLKPSKEDVENAAEMVKKEYGIVS